MEKLRLFIAAAFMAALTGCPTPNPMPDSDTGTPPGDSGMPEVDSGTDPVDAGVDAYVPPGEDGGVDSGTVADVCEDVDYVGLRVQPAVRHGRTTATGSSASAVRSTATCGSERCAVCSTPERRPGTREESADSSCTRCFRFARMRTAASTDARCWNGDGVHLRTGRSLLAELVQPGQQLLALPRHLPVRLRRHGMRHGDRRVLDARVCNPGRQLRLPTSESELALLPPPYLKAPESCLTRGLFSFFNFALPYGVSSPLSRS
jgi:hypothetical protein